MTTMTETTTTWAVMVEEVRKDGLLISHCIAVVEQSGSWRWEEDAEHKVTVVEGFESAEAAWTAAATTFPVFGEMIREHIFARSRAAKQHWFDRINLAMGSRSFPQSSIAAGYPSAILSADAAARRARRMQPRRLARGSLQSRWHPARRMRAVVPERTIQFEYAVERRGGDIEIRRVRKVQQPLIPYWAYIAPKPYRTPAFGMGPAKKPVAKLIWNLDDLPAGARVVDSFMLPACWGHPQYNTAGGIPGYDRAPTVREALELADRLAEDGKKNECPVYAIRLAPSCRQYSHWSRERLVG